ncbi:hydroxymethylbilane synthase, partial [Vibrio parahaemolyticus]
DVNRASLSQLGGRGVFANGLREALAADRCDFLVHSLKDLPTLQPEGLVIAATPRREDARDVVVTRDGTPLSELPAGSRVGTGSPRRIA